jgi:hypothetical protein
MSSSMLHRMVLDLMAGCMRRDLSMIDDYIMPLPVLQFTHSKRVDVSRTCCLPDRYGDGAVRLQLLCQGG